MLDQKKIEEQKRIDANLKRFKNSIVVISGKGGVGKSTVSVNLAFGLAEKGKKVGILDVDIHGPSMGKMLGIEGKPLEVENGIPKPVRVSENVYAVTIASMMPKNDDPIIWRGPLKIGAIKQFIGEIEWPEIDYLIVDSPPGTGDEPLTVMQTLKKPTGSIIVSTPQDIAFLDARKTITFSQKMETPILGLVENMAGFVCPHCGEKIDIFEGTGAKKAAEDFKIDILGVIPIDPNIGKSSDQGKSYIDDFNKLPAAKEMVKIVEKIIAKVEK